jgi:MraZ protein
MFRSLHVHSIDRKGRIGIPSKFRKVITEEYEDEPLMIAKRQRCLVAHPLREWNAIEERALALPQSNPAVMDYFRSYIASAEKCPLDRQGRILIPPQLRAAAGLGQQVMLLGMLRSFEIWDRARYEEEDRRTTDNLPEILGKMEKFEV